MIESQRVMMSGFDGMQALFVRLGSMSEQRQLFAPVHGHRDPGLGVSIDRLPKAVEVSYLLRPSYREAPIGAGR